MSLKHLIAAPVAVLVMTIPGVGRSPIAAETALPMLKSMEPPEICLIPGRSPAPGYGGASEAAYQAATGSAGQTAGRADSGVPPGWPGKQAMGGNVPFARVVYDPHPTFNGMAVDPVNNVVDLERREPREPAHLQPDRRRACQGHDRAAPQHRRVEGQSGLHRRRDRRSRPARDLHGQQRWWRPGRALLRQPRRRGAGARADGAAPVMGTVPGRQARRAGGDQPAVSGHLDLQPHRDQDGSPDSDDSRRQDAARRSARRVPGSGGAAKSMRPITATGPRCGRTRPTVRRCSSASTSPAGSRSPRSASTRPPQDGNVAADSDAAGHADQACVADGDHRRRRGWRAGRRQLRHQRDPHLRQVRHR